MSTLPAIPAGLEPAPEPHRESSELTRLARQLGPLIRRDFYSGVTYVCFPTFGRHEQQSRMLRQADYTFEPRAGAWAKRIDPLDGRRELAWARRLYSALHPGWQVRASTFAGTPSEVDSSEGESA